MRIEMVKYITDQNIKNAPVLGDLVRKSAHRMNNLLLVIQGNMELLSLEVPEKDGLVKDILNALKECREISIRLNDTGKRLSLIEKD
jgi:hypothetical protein